MLSVQNITVDVKLYIYDVKTNTLVQGGPGPISDKYYSTPLCPSAFPLSPNHLFLTSTLG